MILFFQRVPEIVKYFRHLKRKSDHFFYLLLLLLLLSDRIFESNTLREIHSQKSYKNSKHHFAAALSAMVFCRNRFVSDTRLGSVKIEMQFRLEEFFVPRAAVIKRCYYYYYFSSSVIEFVLWDSSRPVRTTARRFPKVLHANSFFASRIRLIKINPPFAELIC